MSLSGEALQQHARDVAAALDGVTRGYPFTPHLQVWKVRSRVFLIVTEDDPNQQTITVKVDPHEGDALRRDLGAVTVGRYLDKRHWISLGPGAGITEELVEDLVRGSCELAADGRGRRRSS